MLDRLMNVWGVLLGALGLVILAALVVIGLELRRARRAGPRWRRRLVAAAMALLSAAGAYLAARNLPPREPDVIMCYEGQMVPQPQGGPRTRLDHLRLRSQLLQKHKLEGRLHPDAARRVRERIAAELADLDTEDA